MNYLIAILGLVMCAGVSDAYAYIDPGTASGFFQIVAAACVAVALFWRRVKAWIGGLFGKKRDEGED